ncbi:MAG: MFS transporter, partial [Anaerolineae bacterium]
GHTVRTAGRYKEFLKFMVAFLIYNDGVIMALDFAAIIGAVLYGLDQQGLIIFIMIVHIANVFGAYIFGIWMDQMGGKRSLSISVLMMLAAIIWLYLNQTQNGFFMIGVLAGVAMAGLQSVSRSMVAVFSPPGQSAEFYGFFAVAGRTSSFIGPTIYGIVAYRAALWYQHQGQAVALAEQAGQRTAILSIGLFFIVGLILLSFVNEKRAREAAKAAP